MAHFQKMPVDVMCQALSVNEEFAVSVAVLKLKIDRPKFGRQQQGILPALRSRRHNR